MKIFAQSAAAIVLALVHSGTSLSVSSHRYSIVSSLSVALPSNRRISLSSARSSRLYSASAALTSDGSVNGDVGGSLNINYGPGKRSIANIDGVSNVAFVLWISIKEFFFEIM